MLTKLTRMIRFKAPDDVQKFIKITKSYPNDFDVISGRRIVDGKSIMGIFSLSLRQNFTLVIHHKNGIFPKDIDDKLSDFYVNKE